MLYDKELDENLKVCQHCQHHFPIGARERINSLVETCSFQEARNSVTWTLDSGWSLVIMPDGRDILPANVAAAFCMAPLAAVSAPSAVNQVTPTNG
jgi:hypothetical protein